MPGTTAALTNPPIDVVAAMMVDHWTDIHRDDSGVYLGKKVGAGEERPVVRYTRDASRALHLIRKAVRDVRTSFRSVEVYITIDDTDVVVEASRITVGGKRDTEEELFYEAADRTDLLPLLLTKCAIEIATKQ